MNRVDEIHAGNEIRRAVYGLTPDQLVQYALANGFEVSKVSTRHNITTLDSITDRFEQLFIPMDDGFTDYTERIIDVVATIGEKEWETTPDMATKIKKATPPPTEGGE